MRILDGIKDFIAKILFKASQLFLVLGSNLAKGRYTINVGLAGTDKKTLIVYTELRGKKLTHIDVDFTEGLRTFLKFHA